MALSDALTEIAEVIGALGGIRACVDDVPDQISEFPLAVVYCTASRYSTRPTGALTEIHDIRIDLVVARKDAGRAMSELASLSRTIPNALIVKTRSTSAGWTYLLTIGEDITCNLITAQWGGADMLVYRYQFDGKIQSLAA